MNRGHVDKQAGNYLHCLWGSAKEEAQSFSQSPKAGTKLKAQFAGDQAQSD